MEKLNQSLWVSCNKLKSGEWFLLPLHLNNLYGVFMRKKRVDKNQPQVVSKLRELGFTVHHIHTVGNGIPDLIVCYNKFNFLVELKSGDLTLTKDEQRFFDETEGSVILANSVETILESMLEEIDTQDLEQVKQHLHKCVEKVKENAG